ncbi:MAG: twin-arginine translocase TatA/TatE family subunit [Calditrichaeota bacterium]|nr:twin-arginine translocase TatA/TatE family subunit [Calditrichota bacterium]
MSGAEIIVVLVAILLLFGGKRLPEIARAWGRKYREMQRVWLDIRQQMNLDETGEMSKISKATESRINESLEQPESNNNKASLFSHKTM